MSSKTAIGIGLLILGVFALPPVAKQMAAKGNAESSDVAAAARGAAVGEKGPPQTLPAPRGTPITQAAFWRIATGMTYPECVAVIGSEGASAGTEPGGVETRVWDNPGVIRAKITFRNGRVAGKGFENSAPKFRPVGVDDARRREQGVGSAVVISVDEYQRLATGMTYEQCVEIIGAPGEKAEVGIGGSGYSPQRRESPTQHYVWRNADTHAYMRFENGRLAEKKWYGRDQ